MARGNDMEPDDVVLGLCSRANTYCLVRRFGAGLQQVVVFGSSQTSVSTDYICARREKLHNLTYLKFQFTTDSIHTYEYSSM